MIVFKDTLNSSVSHVPCVHSQSKTVSLLNGSNVEVGGLNFSFPFSVPSMVQLSPELKRAEEESGSRKVMSPPCCPLRVCGVIFLQAGGHMHRAEG